MKEGVGAKPNMKFQVWNMLNITLQLFIMLLTKMAQKTFKVFRFLLGKFSIGHNVTYENDIEYFACIQLY